MQEHLESSTTLFTSLPDSYTGIDFSNNLYFTEEYNPYTFKNFFNGGGVGIGDFNNDGLQDIYFTGNLVDNKLYKNLGNMHFDDVTNKSNTACKDVWSTGVSLVDINADGLMDIYVCKSGRPDVIGVRHNELFINKGNFVFEEKSSIYGLDFTGLSVHAVFFDYDLDGDLDCYLLNNSIKSIGGYDLIKDQRLKPSQEGGNKLLKCMLAETLGKDKRYQDVTAPSGIYHSEIGFGLGVSVSDLNQDGYPDIFVSNDFFEKDYLYINNQNGTFSEQVDNCMQELSMGSMGADIADMNNDGLQDIFVTEMLPATLERYKSKAVFENYEKSKLNFEKGYHRQYGRNAFHLNSGVIDGKPMFSEISRYAKVEATEWSWGALLEDFDQNGWNDIFVANGIYKDLLDLDHLNFYNPQQIKSMIDKDGTKVITKMFDAMPSSPYTNYLFLNHGDLRFEESSTSQGMEVPTYSNGSAYGDLDNDGDLDLVTNNIGQEASLYRNNAKNDYKVLKLLGEGYNPHAIGSKAVSYKNGVPHLKELYPMKGFQSTVDNRVWLASDTDSLQIKWYDGTVSMIYNIPADSVFTVAKTKISEVKVSKKESSTKTILTKVDDILNHVHIENRFSDFDNNRTQLFALSNEGPTMEVGDLNNDGKMDLIIGASKGQIPIAYLQKNGKLEKHFEFLDEEQAETQAIVLKDFNGDGYLDVYFGNGGSEYARESSGISDRLYLYRAGKYEVTQSQFNLSATADVLAEDIDNDGDIDILSGERLQPKAYGIPADVLLYNQEGNQYAISGKTYPALKGVGMITDMEWGDITGDGIPELLVASEFSSLKVFDTKMMSLILLPGLDSISGRWSDIMLNDIDKDGDLDIIVANVGTNHRVHNLCNGNLVLFVNDFDRNGSVETIPCIEENGKYKPLTLRDDLLMQLPFLKKQLLKYSDYAISSISEAIPAHILKESIVYTMNEFRTGIFYNEADGFVFKPLPKEAQWTDQKAIHVLDLDNNGLLDIILGGNQYQSKPDIGINTASYGQVFLQSVDHNFTFAPMITSGLVEKGEIRDIRSIEINGYRYLIFAKNNAQFATYKINE